MFLKDKITWFFVFEYKQDNHIMLALNSDDVYTRVGSIIICN